MYVKSINEVTLLGSVGKEPMVKNFGERVNVQFSLATNESYKNQDGEWVKNTTWHNVTVWGKPAEDAASELHKGSTVLVRGKLQQRKWDDQQGQTHYVTEINAFNVILILVPRKDGGAQQQQQPEDLPY